MANNRVYLYCPDCNEAVMLAKHMAGPWYFREDRIDAIDSFWDEHWACAPGDGQGGQLLVLRYECTDDAALRLPDDVKRHESSDAYKRILAERPGPTSTENPT